MEHRDYTVEETQRLINTIFACKQEEITVPTQLIQHALLFLVILNPNKDVRIPPHTDDCVS